MDKDILEKQMQLLYERSQETRSIEYLKVLTEQIVNLANCLNQSRQCRQDDVSLAHYLIHLSTSDIEDLVSLKRAQTDLSPAAVLQWNNDREYQLIRPKVKPQENQ